MSNPQQKIGWKTAAGLVISNMIGTGVFTSLGYQLLDVQNTWSILLLWTIGGFLAIIGAFTYAELGTHFKESGGDYIFLSRIFHPFAGYLYAWTSLTIGFSAPIAISAMAMIEYLAPINAAIFNKWFGVGIILMLTTMHSFSVGQSGKLQDITSFLKLAFVAALIVLGGIYTPTAATSIDFSTTWQSEIYAPGFAVALIYVTYAYTGWNSAAYIVGEIDDPRKNLPKALVLGTIVVMVTYLLLQLVFLRQASVEQLAGNVQVADIAFSNMFGRNGGFWVSVFIALQLLATISGYLWVGSRITYAMSMENSLWRFLAIKNSNGIPVRALWLQAAISMVFTVTGTFEQVLLYASFALQLMGTLTIAALLFLKRGTVNTFKSPLRPYLQIIYLLFSFWVLGFMLYERPFESFIGLTFVAVGGITYFFQKTNNKIQIPKSKID